MNRRWVVLALATALGWGTAEAAEAKPPERPSRFKYRDGPVCMCVKGLGEKDIREAERKRQSSESWQPFFSEGAAEQQSEQRGAE